MLGWHHPNWVRGARVANLFPVCSSEKLGCLEFDAGFLAKDEGPSPIGNLYPSPCKLAIREHIEILTSPPQLLKFSSPAHDVPLSKRGYTQEQSCAALALLHLQAAPQGDASTRQTTEASTGTTDFSPYPTVSKNEARPPARLDLSNAIRRIWPPHHAEGFGIGINSLPI